MGDIGAGAPDYTYNLADGVSTATTNTMCRDIDECAEGGHCCMYGGTDADGGPGSGRIDNFVCTNLDDYVNQGDAGYYCDNIKANGLGYQTVGNQGPACNNINAEVFCPITNHFDQYDHINDYC